MKFEFKDVGIEGLVLIKPKIYYDNRGFFLESYTKKEFFDNGIKVEFVQDNHSWSIKNTIRGLHFQKMPYTQAKLVRCISGEIMDVAVDLRKNSKTFGKYIKLILSEIEKNMLFIPEGFAHGFLVLSDYAEVIYKVSNYYNKESEAGIIWNDPEIGIDWDVENPIISEKDLKWPRFSEIKNDLEW